MTSLQSALQPTQSTSIRSNGLTNPMSASSSSASSSSSSSSPSASSSSSSLFPSPSPAPSSLSDASASSVLSAHAWRHRDLLTAFLAPDFDEIRYITASLQLHHSSALLADLAALLAEIDGEISASVLSRQSSLLGQAANIGALQRKLTAAHARLRSLVQSVQRIQAALSAPYRRLCADSAQLAHLQATTEIVRQCQRVLGLVDKMRAVDSVDVKDAVKLAGHVHEVRQVLQETDLQGIDLVDDERAFIADAEERVRAEGHRWLQQSLEAHNQTDLGYALQIFYSLHRDELVTVVELTLTRSLDALISQVRRMTDVTTLTSSAAVKGATGKSAAPSTTSMSSFRSTLWDRVDTLLSTVLSLHLQVSTLDAVLQKKRDAASHALFMDVVAEKRPKGVLRAWWASVCEVLQQELEATSRSSSFVKNVFVNEYPRLHGAFAAMLQRLKGEGRELLRCLHSFEQAYIAKTLTKLNEPLQLMNTSATTTSPSAPVPPPSRSDVNALLHAVNDALGAIHDNDEELQSAVCANVGRALSTFAAHCERLLNVSDDREMLGGSGTGAAASGLSAVQKANAELFVLLSTVEQQMAAAEIKRKYPGIQPAAAARVDKGWQSVHEDEDFSASRAIPPDGSNVIVSLRKRLTFLTRTLLPAYTVNLAEANKQTVIASVVQPVTQRLLTVYLRCVSLVQSIGEEAVRIRVTADLVQFENLLTGLGLRRKEPAIVSLHEFKDRLLFLNDAELTRGWQRPTHVDALAALHFLLSSSSVPDCAVHRLLGLRVRGYIRRVEAAEPAEREALLLQACEQCEAKVQRPPGPAGDSWVREHYPRLEAAKALIRELAKPVVDQNGSSAQH